MKYALEVAKSGSINKAAEVLMVGAPNLSRSIKELETDFGITIFERTQNGTKLTPEGEEFIHYAKAVLKQIDEIENFYKNGAPKKLKFSISVPRACYISEAFANFTKSLSKESAEVFYNETNSQRTIQNINEQDYKLGIIRYAENYDKLTNGLNKLNNAFSQIVDGSAKLSSGMAEYKTSGIDKITKLADDLHKDEDKFKTLSDYAKDYKFTSTNSDAQYETKFVTVIENN